jgi:O-antigen ligase
VSPGALGLPLACMWLLMLVCFSAPEREGPTSLTHLDWIALLKVVIRAGVILALGGALLRSWADVRGRALRASLLPLGLFAAWALASSAWSPLPAVSLGQAVSFVMLVMLALVLGARCHGPDDVSRLLGHLCLALCLVNGAVLTIHVVRPDLSGLHRLGSLGVMHPTSAGASAAMGLTLLLGARLLWGWRWARVLLVPGVLVHGALLYVAAARAALVPTALIFAIALLVLVSGPVRATLVAAASLTAAAYLIVDPSLEALQRGVEPLRHYAERGEPSERLTTLTGRTYLWPRVWSSFLESPLIGHGYFVTSRTGQLDVPEWYRPPANRTAHNAFLQILVSTGVVGIALFGWGLGRLAGRGVRGLADDPGNRRLKALIALAADYFTVAALLGESFMGPVQPESVAFFALLGLVLGTIAARAERRAAVAGSRPYEARGAPAVAA